jgi:hypothetical protein
MHDGRRLGRRQREYVAGERDEGGQPEPGMWSS